MTIETGNAAFESPREIPRILREVASRLGAGEQAGTLLDVNGNGVGRFGHAEVRELES